MAHPIVFQNVTKRYQVRAGQSNLREAILRASRRLLTKRANQDGRSFLAVDDVSFNVAPGEVLGIIGHNGAGKTTILKLLSRVTRPTKGSIGLNGRMSALIELGAGFHPDLTGRENVYLNGVILGLTRREVASKFDSIVAFAELERFLDMPVKHYSSGMYVRLGFAVAIHVEPEVLLVDEVLAVGDMAFQRKCLDKIRDIRAQGATVVLISHHMRTVESLCSRVLWLERGRVREIGDLRPIVAAYTNEMNRSFADGRSGQADCPERRGTGEAQFTAVHLRNGAGIETDTFHHGDDLIVDIAYRARQQVASPSFDIVVHADNGVRVCTATTRLSGCTMPYLEGEGVVRCVFRTPPFTAGRYSITVAIFDREDLMMYDQWHRAASFMVESESICSVRWLMRQEEHGVVYLPPEWEYRRD